MTPTCLWPERNPVTGALCRSIGVRARDYPHTICPHHLAVHRDRQPHRLPSLTDGPLLDSQQATEQPAAHPPTQHRIENPR